MAAPGSMQAIDWGAPFFAGFEALYGPAVTALVMFPALVVLIRVFGKRSTSKMNNFDWIVTVAIGALTASSIAFEEVTIAMALLVIVLLLGLQWGVTHLVERSRAAESIIQEDASVLVFKGQVLDAVKESERVSKKEIDAAIRQAGLTRLDQVYALILESNAEFSVIPVGDARQTDDALAEFDLPPDDYDSPA